MPDGTEFGYRFAIEVGCSAGCEPPEVAWWHAWRLGEPPPRAAPDERARRYATAAVRRQLEQLPDRPTREHLRAAAYQAGGWAAAGELDVEPIASTLLAAARRGGVDDPDIADKLAMAFLAGRARPGRVPA